MRLLEVRCYLWMTTLVTRSDPRRKRVAQYAKTDTGSVPSVIFCLPRKMASHVWKLEAFHLANLHLGLGEQQTSYH